MKEKKYMYVIIEAIILSVIALLTFTVFNSEYLFKWVAHNWIFYLVLGVIALSMTILNKQFISAFMTVGIVIGIFVGNYVGRSIKLLNESKIVEGMKAEEVYRLRHHPGFEIWISIILLSIIIGIIMQIIITKKLETGKF
ncbi:MAG: hypothetical protein FH753_12690 [Firmicutes bacterium]|nr:hypothetical protein [Bacillota bacterium]